jgi:hypothetical protein
MEQREINEVPAVFRVLSKRSSMWGPLTECALHLQHGATVEHLHSFVRTSITLKTVSQSAEP